jgi:alkylation response protein AidB-like acyl-CoA dehydrogenase
MDFSWSKEQQELREAITEFARGSLNDGLVERDREGTFNRAGWDGCARMGIHGLPFPEEFGGLAMDAVTTCGALEALGYGCKDNGLSFSINAQMWTAQMPLLGFGTDAQKQRYLPKLISGEWIGGNAMSEPGSGSDAYSLRTTATKHGDHYRINGSKTFITNGNIADLLVVFATVDPAKGPRGISAFLVEKGMKGLTVGSKIDKMGMRTSPMAELFFDDLEVPEENRLGKEGAGKNLFTDSLTWERACILAPAVGAMQRILETCVEYTRQRKQFGQSISSFQLVSSKLVDMKLRVETARSLLLQAAWKKDQGKQIFMEAALAKLWISESWVACAQDAIQVHGGYGYMTEYEIERELRDATGSKLYSGTSEIQRSIVAPLLSL